ncbi:MAG: hypothetical protein JSS70_11165 [Bacteroidetes bacterium]|nr:hypothetical protein [Bacteroidota bacterium]
MKRFFISLTGFQLILIRVSIAVLSLLLFIFLASRSTTDGNDFAANYITGFFRVSGVYIFLQGIFRWLWWRSINSYLLCLLPEKDIRGLRTNMVIDVAGIIYVLIWSSLFFTGLVFIVIVYPWVFFILFGINVAILIFYLTAGRERTIFPYKAVKAILGNKSYDSVSFSRIGFSASGRITATKQLQDDVRQIYLRYGYPGIISQIITEEKSNSSIS